MKTAVIDTATTVAIFEKYLTPILGKKLTNLVIKRTRHRQTEFIDRVIRPNLFLGDTYTPVSDKLKTPGRNPDWAEMIAKDTDVAERLGVDPLQAMTFFANPLRTSQPTISDDGTLEYEAPSLRVCCGQYIVLTLEHDVLDPAFLRAQIALVYFAKNALECPMGAFYKACSKFSDFVGITVVYGGNKSLHIHVVFDTTLADEAFALGDRSSGELRRGYVLLWERVQTIFQQTVDIGGHLADRHLRFPEAYRRMPNGHRIVGEDHIAGIPEGTELPQITLWEKYDDRAAGAALFITPDVFTPEPDMESKKLHRRRVGRVGPMSAKQHAYCELRLRKMFSTWPRFDRLIFEGDRYKALFANSANDRTPSSFMKEDYKTICLIGTDADQAQAVSLPAPLGDMLRMFREQMQGGAQAPRDEADLDEGQQFVRDLEDRFSKNVTDKPSAYHEMEAVLQETVAEFPLMMVVGPEGASKTTTLMRNWHVYAKRMRDRGDSEQGMFAFANYDDAEKKCAHFNLLQGVNGFIGMVLPSSSRLYETTCGELELREISRVEAIRQGYSNIFEAILDQQPEVVAVFKTWFENFWAQVGMKKLVFFVVHQTMQFWKTNSRTRLMSAKSFWTSREDPDQEGRSALLRQETVIGIAVHDEVKTEHIVGMHQEEVIRWAGEVTRRKPWQAKPRDLAQCLRSFEGFVAAKGKPVVRGQTVSISFDEVRAIEMWLKTDPDPVIARDSGEYQIKALARDEDGEEQVNAYEAAHGAAWRVGEREWWNGLAHHVILLTTEKVPTALVAATTSPWTIFELKAPLMPKDVVHVHPQRSVTGENLESICADFRELHPETFIISNKAKTVVNTVPHVTARGSNDMIGKDVMQTMTHITPSQYEQLQVLNEWTGRSDLVGLHHVDEFNQSAGRNLGFRHQEGVAHTLLINRRLFTILTTHSALSHSRYTFQPIMDKDQRYAMKKAARERS